MALMRVFLSSVAVLCALLGAPAAVHAVNKCTGPNGETVFSDKACPPAAGSVRQDPVPVPPERRGGGALTPEQRKAIVDKMNADVATAIVKQAKEEAEAERQQAKRKPVTVSQPMEFNQCRLLVAQTLLSVAGYARTMTVLDTKPLTMHRICLTDGSMLLTCSLPDQKFVRTTSPPDGRGC